MTVKYTNPEPGEEGLRFLLLDPDLSGPSAMIQSLDFPDWRFKPVSTVVAAEVVAADDLTASQLAELRQLARR